MYRFGFGPPVVSLMFLGRLPTPREGIRISLPVMAHVQGPLSPKPPNPKP